MRITALEPYRKWSSVFLSWYGHETELIYFLPNIKRRKNSRSYLICSVALISSYWSMKNAFRKLITLRPQNWCRVLFDNSVMLNTTYHNFHIYLTLRINLYRKSLSVLQTKTPFLTLAPFYFISYCSSDFNLLKLTDADHSGRAV
jgi:hypothetical protein